MAKADLIIANGGGFDDWLFSLVENAARADALVITVSEGLEAIEHGHGHDHHGDAHFWLSVPHAIYYVEKISQALTALSPDNAAYFQGRAAAYRDELVELDRWMLGELSKISAENRVIVTYHNAFSYLAERYGFEVAEFLVANPDAEPTPRDLARLTDLLRRTRHRAIFTEPQIGSGTRYLQSLAKEVKGEIYVLYSDSLSPEISTYLEMMRYNTQTLVEALDNDGRKFRIGVEHSESYCRVPGNVVLRNVSWQVKREAWRRLSALMEAGSLHCLRPRAVCSLRLKTLVWSFWAAARRLGANRWLTCPNRKKWIGLFQLVSWM